MKALDEAGKVVDWAYWPRDLRRFILDWNSVSDCKWRSNVLWYDYLRVSAAESAPPPTCTFSTLQIPIPPLVTSDMRASTLLDFLKTHFRHTNTHAIAGLIHQFSTAFANFYTDSVSATGDIQLAVDITSTSDACRVAEEVKSFVTVAIAGFQSYYGGMDFAKLVRERTVGINDLVIEEIMHTRVHDVLLQVYSLGNAAKEAVYQQKLKDFANIRCADLGIEPLFCIDQVRSHISEPQGYGRAVDMLRELVTTTSPVGKLNVIIAATRRVCECIDEYWQGTPQIPAESLVINADQILSIFIYLTLKARIRNLMSHLFLIIEFVRTEVQQGSYGYYLATVEASVQHILLMEDRTEGQGNESFFTCPGD